MKKTRKLIPALAMLLISAVMMSTASFAWFSMNTSVTATGVQVNATTEGSLVIGNNVVVGTAITTSIAGTTTLKPMAYIDGAYKYPTSLGNIGADTGLDKDGGTIAMTEVGTTSGYYIDKVVYLAASGKTLENKTLTATVTYTYSKDGVETALDDEHKAVTVAFAVLSQTATAKSTTVVTDVDDTKKVVAKDATAADIVNHPNVVSDDVALGTVTFPLNTTNESIPVIIRIYIDGQVGPDANSAYVNNENGNIENITIDVKFTIA